jgi:Spy/CpxP family protein refolding chaperone
MEETARNLHRRKPPRVPWAGRRGAFSSTLFTKSSNPRSKLHRITEHADDHAPGGRQHGKEQFLREAGLTGHHDGSQIRNGEEIAMNGMGATVTKTLGMLAILAMIPASGFAFGGHGGGRHRQGPPQEAIDACAGFREGDSVQFTSPRGDAVSGTCQQIRGKLVAVPKEGPPGGPTGMGPGRHFARMAKALDLTEAQKEQVKAILASEREKTAPLRQKLAETREKIRRTVGAEPFDEAAVRSLAASQNETRTEMIVSRARTQSQIFSLLSPEQQERAKKFRAFGEKRHGRGPWM